MELCVIKKASNYFVKSGILKIVILAGPTVSLLPIFCFSGPEITTDGSLPGSFVAISSGAVTLHISDSEDIAAPDTDSGKSTGSQVGLTTDNVRVSLPAVSVAPTFNGLKSPLISTGINPNLCR